MIDEESINEPESPVEDIKPSIQQPKISISVIPKSSYDLFIETILNDINSLKPVVNEYLKQTLISKQTSSEFRILVNDKQLQLNLPVFSFIITNPIDERIPTPLLRSYVGETNYSGQTPLMFAAAIDNLNYVTQLIQYDVGRLDEFGKSALDYAYEFNAAPAIVDLLEQFEYGN